jgi:hypothetical protein
MFIKQNFILACLNEGGGSVVVSFDFLACNVSFLNWGCLYNKSQLFHIRWGVGALAPPTYTLKLYFFQTKPNLEISKCLSSLEKCKCQVEYEIKL